MHVSGIRPSLHSATGRTFRRHTPSRTLHERHDTLVFVREFGRLSPAFSTGLSMSRSEPDAASSGGIGVSTALTVLAGFLAFQPIRMAIERLTVDSTGPGVAGSNPELLSVAVASSVLAFVASWCALVALRSRRGTQRMLARIAADATRIAMGERAVSVAAGTRAFSPIADALNRLASLGESAEALLVDRDRQLAVLRGHLRVGYWETDAGGRFQRLEFETSWQAVDRPALVGCTQFEHAAPLDGSAWRKALEALAARRPFGDLVLERTLSDGRTIRVVETGEPRFHDGEFVGFCGTVRRLGAEATALDSAARTALETASEAALLLARAPWPAPVVWMNAAACTLLGQSAKDNQEAIGALFGLGDTEDKRALDEAIRARRPLRRRVRLRDRYGETCEALARLEPIDDGSMRTILLLDTEAAELLALRNTRGEAEALRPRVRQLEMQLRQLEAFSWSVSHDLRAPLRVIDGFARIVLEDHGSQLDSAGRTDLGRVLAASARMERMIDALSTLSRLSNQPLVSTPVELDRLATEILATLARQEPSRVVRVSCEPGLRAEGDPALLRILLQNLLDNAWKYSSKRPEARIRFDAHRDERGRTVYCVADNGVGFDAMQADRLFGAFQRLHANEDYPGTGIGLAVARRIVERHGGSIWAESTPGDGCRFYFTLGGSRS